MREIEFKNWLIKTGTKSKIASDTVSRLKRLEKELNYCDIDKEYEKDKCQYLLNLFRKTGKNADMDRYHDIRLPIGKYYMSTYRYALKKYICFLQISDSDKQ